MLIKPGLRKRKTHWGYICGLLLFLALGCSAWATANEQVPENALPSHDNTRALTVATKLTLGADVGNLQEIWLAGLACGPNRPLTDIALVWKNVTTGWFPTWKLYLKSARQLIPASISPTSSLDDTYLAVGSATVVPIDYNEYETWLSYDSQTGDLEFLVRNTTSGVVIASANLRIDPSPEGLSLRPTSSEFSNPIVDIQPAVSLTYLTFTRGFVPVSVQPQFYLEQSTPQKWVKQTSTWINRQQYSGLGLEIALPDSSVTGRLRVFATQENQLWQIADMRNPAGLVKLKLPIDALPVGTSTITTQLEVDGHAFTLDERDVTIGGVTVTVSLVDGDSSGTVVTGLLTLKTDGYLPPFVLHVGAEMVRLADSASGMLQETREQVVSQPVLAIPLAVTGADEREYRFRVSRPTDRVSLWHLRLTPQTSAGIGITVKGEQQTVINRNLDEEPVEHQSSERERIYLNGPWQFQPAITPFPSNDAWGVAYVPGSWRRIGWPPTRSKLVERGAGPIWQDFDEQLLQAAWYARKIKVPVSWAGQAILLEFTRVSTDAAVYIDGKEVGRVFWPGDVIDVTDVLNPGVEATLLVKVAATSDPDQVMRLLGATPGLMYGSATKTASAGLIGDVVLFSRPRGTYISDVFVITSTRQHTLGLDIELADVTEAGDVEVIARLLDESGKEEKRFTAQLAVNQQDLQVIHADWDWSDPRLWDLDKPNLYTLLLDIHGKGWHDEYAQQFGFREFWIEGRKFYLNGVEFKPRPMVLLSDEGGGVPAVIDSHIDSLRTNGFTLQELWPEDRDVRGSMDFQDIVAARADAKGWPITAIAPDVGPYITKWTPEVKSRWLARDDAVLRELRNHPSILMWGTSSNVFGGAVDPRLIGKDHPQNWNQPTWHISRFPRGKEAMDMIRSIDPTRPVFAHNGGTIGDVYTLNFYPNLMPLQDREEWLSNWVAEGDMPFWVVEFGTPLHTTFQRGRDGYTQARVTEPLMTEYTAMYFGNEAYANEPEEYRQRILSTFQGGQQYLSWQNDILWKTAPSFQALQDLFIRNTWRSWRTAGLSIAPMPWDNAYAWIATAGAQIDLGEFQPGQPGAYERYMPLQELRPFTAEGGQFTPAGKALLEVSQPTLAWIAGSTEAFTAKDHSFTAGQMVEKQVVLINDTRMPQEFHYEWQVIVGEQTVAAAQGSGSIAPAQTCFFPIQFTLPIVSSKSAGEIRLNATIGEARHSDTFAFRIFPAPDKAAGTITVFDPVGETTALLQSLGYTVQPWEGHVDTTLLVIGRKALSARYTLPGNLEAYVGGGGRAIIFAQDPDWLRNELGMRVAWSLSRRVFPISATHPVVKGLDATDLRDWSGTSTLVEPYPNYLTETNYPKTKEGYPYAGWRWGGRGALSSAMLEKPHRSSWRPILEGEFDLAYTPLMELDYGAGRLIMCTLDLEDHAQTDPAARQLALQLIDYAASSAPQGKTGFVSYVGDATGAAVLNELGVIFKETDHIDPAASLVAVGAGVPADSLEIQAYLAQGGQVLVLPRQEQNLGYGVQAKRVTAFPGSLDVPSWQETTGLSASDLRWRVDGEAWLVTAGADIGSGGQLARLQVGSGTIIFAQLNPNQFNADTNTYFRYTRWRQTRALSQILANMGASFVTDKAIFTPGTAHPSFYHEDYRDDFELGDDPYRWYNW